MLSRSNFFNRLAILLTSAAALMLIGTPAFAAKVFIDYVDTEGHKQKKGIKFYLDILDQDFNVIEGQDPNEIKFFFDDVEVPGTVTLESAKDANENVAIALLVAAHNAYTDFDEESGMPQILGLEKQGFGEMLKKLTENDYIAIWYYNEAGLHDCQSWSTNIRGAGERLESCVKAGEKMAGQAPPLYNSVKNVMEKIAEQEDLPRRKFLVLMSDGKDKIEKRSQLQKRMTSISDTAATAGAKVYAVGFTVDVKEPLVQLGELATKTKGVYREVKDEEIGSVPDILERIATEMQKQYVVTFTPTDYSGDDEKQVEIRVELKAADGSRGERSHEEQIIIPSQPFEIWPIIKIVLIVLGSLLGVFLLIKLFGALARRRADTDEEVEEEEFTGAYKGKLTCQSGQYAGAEFYLTEDVTTIGSIAGNTIVLQETGVSKRHAGIKIDDMRFELADFGSTNGTYVNGSKITKQFLRDQDLVKIGDSELKFTLK